MANFCNFAPNCTNLMQNFLQSQRENQFQSIEFHESLMNNAGNEFDFFDLNHPIAEDEALDFDLNLETEEREPLNLDLNIEIDDADHDREVLSADDDRNQPSKSAKIQKGNHVF